ncbi:Flp pilus assembly protein CpaB [Arthrobacter sp. Helios]|uniref:Flp pilus assembly protein CpaB n=1 Tax=Arthrobacter sp. Helios TaxID=2828862 RepID=UPI00206AD61B|nr:Flp pilus assembly protein CpaB [Arthrobacter sp. Helios]UPO75736.1 Flp pilus assembly protein CpaB [Arthrobacter sp. Helios]
MRHRRLLAGVLAALACGVAVEAYLPPDARTVSVVTAGADLPAGHVLGPGDLRVVSLPAAADPPGSFAPGAAVTGKRLAVPLRAGSVLTDSFLVGPGLLAGSPAGTSAVPLRAADPAVTGLLSPGVLVDVMLAPGDNFDGAAAASLLAAGVPVLWIGGDAPDDGGSWPGSAETDAGLVVVAARGQDAPALAGASERGNLYLVLSGG